MLRLKLENGITIEGKEGIARKKEKLTYDVKVKYEECQSPKSKPLRKASPP